jgi:hypothetical protein
MYFSRFNSILERRVYPRLENNHDPRHPKQTNKKKNQAVSLRDKSHAPYQNQTCTKDPHAKLK